MQWLELAMRIPPAMGELAEFLEFVLVGVEHGRTDSLEEWKQKSPAEAGLSFTAAELLLGADDFDINATVRLQASNNLRALRALALIRLRHWLLAAFAFGVDAVSRDALADHVVLDCSSALFRQLLVVSSTTDTVGMPHSDNDFQIQLTAPWQLLRRS